MKTRDLVNLVILGAIWGASFLFMRISAPEFGPVPLVEVRVAIAAVFLTSVMVARGGSGDIRGKLAVLTVLGAINSALPFTLFAFAMLHLTAGFGAVLNASTPLFGALVAYLWLRDRLSGMRIVGLAIGFLGVVILVWNKVAFRGDGSGWAVMACLVAALAYGIAVNYTKKHLTGVNATTIAAMSQIAATVLLLPLAIVYWPTDPPSLSGWLSATALGIICTAIPYMMFFRLLARVGPARAVTVTYLLPVFGMLWGFVFLHEAVTWSMAAGCAVIFLGTAMATGVLGRRRRILPS